MAYKVDCICGVLEEIHGFFSLLEFERFRAYIEKNVNSGELIEVPVKESYAGFPEQWYKCQSCARIWRLVHPDFPFKGLWLMV